MLVRFHRKFIKRRSPGQLVPLSSLRAAEHVLGTERVRAFEENCMEGKETRIFHSHSQFISVFYSLDRAPVTVPGGSEVQLHKFAHTEFHVTLNKSKEFEILGENLKLTLHNCSRSCVEQAVCSLLIESQTLS